MIKYKIRDSDWLTFPLIIVNFNHFFIQPAPELNLRQILQTGIRRTKAQNSLHILDIRNDPYYKRRIMPSLAVKLLFYSLTVKLNKNSSSGTGMLTSE